MDKYITLSHPVKVHTALKQPLNSSWIISCEQFYKGYTWLTVKRKKKPEISALINYEDFPNNSFWEFFPKADLPKLAVTKVNASVIDISLEENYKLLTDSQKIRVKRAIEFFLKWC